MSSNFPRIDCELDDGLLPEVKLVLAVIDRALRDLEIIPYTNRRRVGKVRKEALWWFEDDSYVPWSFLWCCDVGDVNPNYIRRLMKVFENGDPYGFKRRVKRTG